MWSVKLSYSLPGQDVLVAQFLGEENVLQLAAYLFESEPDPIPFPILIYMSEDKSKSDIFITWANQAAFDNWYSVHGDEWEALLNESNAYGAGQGIQFNREYPPYEDYDWATVAPPDMILVDDLFVHLSNATN
jgi:hypothetical protein